MFDRFEDDCKRAMNEARKEAQRLGHDFLDAEHMVLGLLRVPGCTALRMLEGLHCDLAAIGARAEALMSGGRKTPEPQQLPFTPRAKRVLERTMEEAGSRGNKSIGTQHLLLGYAHFVGDQSDDQAAKVLGVDVIHLQAAVDSIAVEPPAAPGSSARERLAALATLAQMVHEDLALEGHHGPAARTQEMAWECWKLSRGIPSKSPT